MDKAETVFKKYASMQFVRNTRKLITKGLPKKRVEKNIKGTSALSSIAGELYYALPKNSPLRTKYYAKFIRHGKQNTRLWPFARRMKSTELSNTYIKPSLIDSAPFIRRK